MKQSNSKISKKLIFSFGFLLFLLFVFFSYLTHKDIFTAFDFDTTIRLQDNVSRKFDELFSLLSLVGGFEIASLFLLVLLAIKRKVGGIFVLFFYGLVHVFELFGKTFVSHLPPPEFMLRTERIGDFPQFYVRSDFSYPSGHAARAAFISVVIAIFLLRTKKLSPPKKIIILSIVFVFDMMMFVSRAYLGEHWATDVIGGGLLGAALALISVVFI